METVTLHISELTQETLNRRWTTEIQEHVRAAKVCPSLAQMCEVHWLAEKRVMAWIVRHPKTGIPVYGNSAVLDPSREENRSCIYYDARGCLSPGRMATNAVEYFVKRYGYSRIRVSEAHVCVFYTLDKGETTWRTLEQDMLFSKKLEEHQSRNVDESGSMSQGKMD